MGPFSATRISAALKKTLWLLIVLSGPGAVTVNAQPADDAAARKPLQIKGPNNAENLVTGETTENPMNKPLHAAAGDALTINWRRNGGTWTYVFTGDEPTPLEFSARYVDKRAELRTHRPEGEELIGLKIYDTQMNQTQFEELCRTHPGVVTFQIANSARELTDLTPLRHFTRLTALRVRHISQVPDLEPLAGLKNLLFVDIERCDRVATLEPLAGLKNLIFLNIRSCDRLTTLEPLSGLENLRVLKVHLCKTLQDIQALAQMSNLEQLAISCPYKNDDITPLGKMTSLRRLSVATLHYESELQPLAGLHNLTHLTTGYRADVTTLKPLAGLTRLEEINLTGYIRKPISVAPLSRLKNLRRIKLSGRVTELEALSACESLTDLEINGCDRLVPLPGAKKLRNLSIGCGLIGVDV